MNYKWETRKRKLFWLLLWANDISTAEVSLRMRCSRGVKNDEYARMWKEVILVYLRNCPFCCYLFCDAKSPSEVI
jgi:hypothetical protein